MQQEKGFAKQRFIWVSVIIFAVLLVDQLFKFWIKTNFVYGEERAIMGKWFYLLFTENNGMAFGLEFAGQQGKLILTLFRILAVAGIGYYLARQIRSGAHRGFVYCLALIMAGALGNIIDSVFYGVIFKDINLYPGAWFHGRVVDMLYFPIVETTYPSWFPVYGGEQFIFFRPVFNLADSAISIGVITIFLFQRRFFKKLKEEENTPVSGTGSEVQ